MAQHSHSLLLSAESAWCPVIPISRTAVWKTELTTCCKLAQRQFCLLEWPGEAARLERDGGGYGRWRAVSAVRPGEWWEEPNHRSCRLLVLSGHRLTGCYRVKRRAWWRGCWWPITCRVMDGGGGHDWGHFVVASVCLHANMAEAEHYREEFKSTECKKHLRVKSQNVKNAEKTDTYKEAEQAKNSKKGN